MKKLSIFAVALLMAGFIFNQSYASAQNGKEVKMEEKDTTNYVKSSGIVKDVVVKNDNVTLTVASEGKEPITTIFTINDETLLWNSGSTNTIQKDSFKKGQRIDAYYDKNKPMIMIYPAQISPELVIVHDEKKPAYVKVSQFDNNFVSLDNKLKLNISKETIIVNEKGEKVKQQDLNGKELVVFYTFTTRSIPSQTTPSKIVAVDSMSQEDTSNYMKSSGIIKDVSKKDGKVTLTVVTEEKEPQTTIFTINKDTLAYNSGTAKATQKESIKKGQRIDAYYDKNKPMILIYPAQISPELVILHDEKKLGSVKVAKFDDEFLSLDKELKLNIGKETVLVNEKGEKIEKEDLHGKELVVFYTITTMSIPAQTPPNKIVAINYLSPEIKEVQNIIEKDHYMQNGTKMIPLKKVAEYLGYDVKSHPKKGSNILTLGNSSLTITLGEKTYSYNRSLRQFAEKPILKNNNIYVSEDILELLIQQ
ncbi:stalk domain-containing protein [Psychrobacillus vulpis]|uniref:Copper amine oxidase N-terminal domain-containing protein n=1 Tax=Psychrobacillus vulpis TaxID=2325572 RepID=A0A544TVX5_9BACI|nr:stalk domain-containing protein [Psychrobacillus vulpis]TQR21603.1 copper amine oxidase N-terminal domain-containing protein [Psychrobacillus vulpis]